jgi:putative ABC transport system permease protein
MFRSLRSIGRDLATAARRLARRPAYAGLAAGLFALGVGAIATIFAVVSVTMLRPLPYRDADALVHVNSIEASGTGERSPMALGYFQFARSRSDSSAFVALEGFTDTTMKLLGGAEPEPVIGALVSAGFFDVLGWRPERGRSFTRAEELPGSGVMMISHDLWVSRFATDPSIVGRVVNVDEEPREIVGVMPAGFPMPLQRADAWLPLPLGPKQFGMKARLIRAIGRLRPGTTVQQAVLDLDRVNAALGKERPDEHRFTAAEVKPLREAMFGEQRATLFALLAAGFVLLAVATVNVTSLAFGDVVARRVGTMTRIAMGAKPWDVARLRLTDIGVITAIGCAVGLALARGALAVLDAMAPEALAGIRGASLDWRVLAVAIVSATIAGLFAAVPTALQEAGFTAAGLAGTGAKSIGDRSDRRRRDGLLVAQVGLAVVLLVGATLLARNVRALLERPTGFETDGVTVVELTFSPTRYPTPPARSQHARALLESVRALPGVSAAATIQTRFALNESMQTLFEIEGRAAPTGEQRFVNIRHTTPDVEKVLRLHLRKGRLFTEADREGSLPVAVVSAEFAKKYWPGEDPVGRRVRRISSQEAPWMEVVGIVDDIADAGAGIDVGPVLFVSYLQQNTPMARPTIVVRSSGSPETLFPALRRAIWSVDPNQTIDSISRLDDLMLRSAAQPRFAALVAGMLAISAILLVLCGIYAVTLHRVLRQKREIGLRAALGASRPVILWTTLRQSLLPVLAGVVTGALVCVPAVRAMRSLLAESVSLADAPALAAALAAIVAASALAALVPARHALAVPPSLAMRDEG